MEQKKYFAFISYKREDEKWAKWLQHELEHYRLPLNVRKADASLPKEIRPVFKDTSELAAGVLANEIHDALENSKYLIVVCSPRSSKSEWVGKEVQTFIDMGRSEYIIPFIIAGKAFSDNPDEECFPLSLREMPKESELLGVNINEMGREAAVVKVVARMFGLQFDTLWQRREREKRMRRNRIIAAVAVFVLSVMGVAGWIWHQNVELEARNTLINRQNVALDAKTDSLLKANDSIQNVQRALKQAYYELEVSRKGLAISNENLLTMNVKLKEEKTKLFNANWNKQKNLSMFIATRTHELIDRGEFCLARQISLEILPKNVNYPDKPITPEAEALLRCASQIGVDLKGHSLLVYESSFSKDGKYIASASNDSLVIVWDTRTGGIVSKIEHPDKVMRVSFCAGGKKLLSLSGGKIRVWNLKTGKCEKTFDGFRIASLSPDEKYISTAMGDDIHIIDYQTGKLVASLSGHTLSPLNARFSPNGHLLASCGDDRTIVLWDVVSWEIIKIISGHNDFISTVDFSPDSKHLISASVDGTCKIWDVETGKKENEIKMNCGFNSASFSPDGNWIVTASEDGAVRVWWIHPDGPICRKMFKVNNYNIYDASFSPDGKQIVSSSYDRIVRIWNIMPDWKVFGKSTFAFSPDGKFIASESRENHDIVIHELNTGRKVAKLQGHNDKVVSIVYGEGKRLYTIDSGGQYRSWNLQSGTCLDEAQINEIGHESPNICNNGQYVLTTNSSGRIWDLKTRQWKKLYNSIGKITSVDNSPDNKKIVVAALDGMIRVYDLETGDMKTIFRGHRDSPHYASFSSDGEHVVSSDNNEIFIWNVADGACIKNWKVSKTALDNSTSLNLIKSVRFNHDNSLIISSHYEGLKCKIMIWDSNKGVCIQQIDDIDFSAINYASFSPDNKYIAVAEDDCVRVLKYPCLQEVIDKTRACFKEQSLTSEERKKYFLE